VVVVVVGGRGGRSRGGWLEDCFTCLGVFEFAVHGDIVNIGKLCCLFITSFPARLGV
jgi:hypothetical protein